MADAKEFQVKTAPQKFVLSGNVGEEFVVETKSGANILSVSGDGKVAFFGKANVAQAATPSSETADGTYSANEQEILQKCYDVLKGVGLIL